MVNTLKIFVTVLAFIYSSLVFADYPEKSIRLVVPFAAGGTSEIVARSVASSLSTNLGQSVYVDNKPGGAGNIAMEEVKRANPDGYTLILGHVGTLAVNPALFGKKLPYDPLKSLVDVAILGQTPYVMITAADGPYQNIRDLVIAAKSKPGEITFASAGVGSSTHLAAEYFNQLMGIKLIHVPYKGSPEAIQDTMSGRTAFYMAPLDTAIGQLKGGKVRALGVTSKTRNAAVPDIPSIAEQGYPNFEIGLWFGVWAPAGTPPAIVSKINQSVNQSMQDPEVKTAYENKGIKATPMSPSEFSKFVREEMAKYLKIAKEAAIEPQ